MIKILNALKPFSHYARYALFIALGLTVFWLTKTHYQTRLIEEKNACLAIEREQHTAQNAALKNALIEAQKWQQRAQEESLKLAKLQEEIDEKAKNEKKQVAYIIQKDESDGMVYNGLGFGSVQLYNRALGYRTEQPESQRAQ